MSDLNNPFQSPQTDAKIVSPLVSQGNLTGIMLKHLSDTSPWLTFIGIMGFIGSGFMFLGGLVCLILMPFATTLFESSSSFFSEFLSMFSVMILYALYFIGAGVIMFFPAFFTYRFGRKIRNYIVTNTETELELALKNNKSLWKFQGILLIVGMAAVPVLVIVGIIVAVAFMAIS